MLTINPVHTAIKRHDPALKLSFGSNYLAEKLLRRPNADFFMRKTNSTGAIESIVRKVESEIVTSPIEIGAIICSRTGVEAFERIKGNINSINLKQDPTFQFMIAGNIFTHNHPSGSICLSLKDVQTSLLTAPAEMRAVSGTGRAALVIPEKFRKDHPTYKAKNEFVKDNFMDTAWAFINFFDNERTQNGDLHSKAVEVNNFWQRTFKDISKKTGYDFIYKHEASTPKS